MTLESKEELKDSEKGSSEMKMDEIEEIIELPKQEDEEMDQMSGEFDHEREESEKAKKEEKKKKLPKKKIHIEKTESSQDSGIRIGGRRNSFSDENKDGTDSKIDNKEFFDEELLEREIIHDNPVTDKSKLSN